MLVFLLIVSVVLLAYFGLMALAAIGWLIGDRRLKHEPTVMPKSDCGVSIVVAFRNEEDNLPRLIEQLKGQNYSPKLLEIILVNDNSTDRWRQKVDLASMSAITVIDNSGHGKKSAIFEGVKCATHSIILTTDADCWLSPNWVVSMAAEFIGGNCELLFGPVNLKGNSSFLSYFQSLDYHAMATFGAGTSNLGAPFLCSGANLMFKKSCYLSVFEELCHQFLSGDDVFLLHAFKRHRFPISFAQSSGAVVISDVQESWSALVNQRIRWGSKAGAYSDCFAIAVSLIIFGANCLMAFALLMLPIFLVYTNFVITLLLIKITIDSILISLSSRLFGFKKRLFYTLISGFIYPFWITFVALKGFGNKGVWKGR